MIEDFQVIRTPFILFKLPNCNSSRSCFFSCLASDTDEQPVNTPPMYVLHLRTRAVSGNQKRLASYKRHLVARKEELVRTLHVTDVASNGTFECSKEIIISNSCDWIIIPLHIIMLKLAPAFVIMLPSKTTRNFFCKTAWLKLTLGKTNTYMLYLCHVCIGNYMINMSIWVRWFSVRVSSDDVRHWDVVIMVMMIK